MVIYAKTSLNSISYFLRFSITIVYSYFIHTLAASTELAT